MVVTLAQILSLAILARAVLSWFPTSRTLLPVVDVLNTITDPVLVPIRRWMPAVGGLDLSPLLAIFLVGVMESLLLGMLAGH